MTAQITSPNNPGHTASWYAWSANDKTIRPALEGALEADHLRRRRRRFPAFPPH